MNKKSRGKIPPSHSTEASSARFDVRDTDGSLEMYVLVGVMPLEYDGLGQESYLAEETDFRERDFAE